MPRKRLSGPRRQARVRNSKKSNRTQTNTSGLRVHHFAGVSLAGGKTDKTCVAILEVYPQQNKIFLSRLVEGLKSDSLESADQKILNLLDLNSLDVVGFDAPLQLPKCMRCDLKCPGYEKCKEPEIEWMWKQYKKLNLKRKPKRLFTPYTERCIETYLAHQIEEVFHMPHAMGSNLAPLTARAHFLRRRFKKTRLVECFPKLSIWRLGLQLKIPKSHLRFHRHSVGGDESRKLILTALVDSKQIFIYEQDFKVMVENNHAFEAFITAYTSLLDVRGECEPRPKDFPKQELWLSIPLKKVDLIRTPA